MQRKWLGRKKNKYTKNQQKTTQLNLRLFLFNYVWQVKDTAFWGFRKLNKISINTNIGIRGFTAWKQKDPVTEC